MAASHLLREISDFYFKEVVVQSLPGAGRLLFIFHIQDGYD